MKGTKKIQPKKTAIKKDLIIAPAVEEKKVIFDYKKIIPEEERIQVNKNLCPILIENLLL